jgi:hypothetical protein
VLSLEIDSADFCWNFSFQESEFLLCSISLCPYRSTSPEPAVMNAPLRFPATQSRANRERAQTPTARSGGMRCDGAWNEARKKRARQKIWKGAFLIWNPCNPLKLHKTAKAFFGNACRKTSGIWKSLQKDLETRHNSAGNGQPLF